MSLKTSGIAVVATFVALAGIVTYSCGMAGPTLSARRIDGRVHIEGRFLGEYALGFERVRIEEAATDAVVCDLTGRAPADLDLVPGVNTPGTMWGRGATMTFAIGSGACRLSSGHDYRVTVWGNNGWGHVRPSSIDIRF